MICGYPSKICEEIVFDIKTVKNSLYLMIFQKHVKNSLYFNSNYMKSILIRNRIYFSVYESVNKDINNKNKVLINKTTDDLFLNCKTSKDVLHQISMLHTINKEYVPGMYILITYINIM